MFFRYWNPAGVFVEADSNLSIAREESISEPDYGNMHAFVFASKAPVNERFRASLSDIGIKSSCIASPQGLGSVIDTPLPLRTDKGSLVQRFVVVAPGEEAAAKQLLESECDRLNIKFVSCKPGEL